MKNGSTVIFIGLLSLSFLLMVLGAYLWPSERRQDYHSREPEKVRRLKQPSKVLFTIAAGLFAAALATIYLF